MNSSKYFLVGIVLLSVAGLATAQTAPITITVTPSLSPNVYGSPSWAGYVANAIYALENNQSSYGDPSLPTYYSEAPSAIYPNQNIVTGYPSWNGVAGPTGDFAHELGNRLLFGAVIKGDGETQFMLKDLSFVMASTDPGNSLGWSYAAGVHNYGSNLVGIIWNEDGSISKTSLTNPSDFTTSTLVDEIVYVGHGNAPDDYTAPPVEAQQASLDALAASYAAVAPYSFTGTYSIMGSDRVAYQGMGGVTVVPVPAAVLLGIGGLGLVGLLKRRFAK